MFGVSRKEQHKVLNEISKAQFIKEYEELCKKHKLQWTPVLFPARDAIVAIKEIVPLGADEKVRI